MEHENSKQPSVIRQGMAEKCPKAEVKRKSTDRDTELDELLDSALADFETKPKSERTLPSHGEPAADTTEPWPTCDPQTVGDTQQPAGTASNRDTEAEDALFNQLFSAAMSEDTGQNLEEVMKKFMSADPDLLQQFDSLAREPDPTAPVAGPTEAAPNVEDAIQQALGSMAQNAQDLQGGLPEEELMRLMSGLGLDEGGGVGPDSEFMPMMQTMMKSLLSKEVLYPSLKELTNKYPVWFEEHEAGAEPRDLDRYRRQFSLMSDIVREFESEAAEDSEEVTSRRLTTIMDKMQDMQELGHPPQELVGDMPAGMDGMPKLPTGEQCRLM